MGWASAETKPPQTAWHGTTLYLTALHLWSPGAEFPSRASRPSPSTHLPFLQPPPQAIHPLSPQSSLTPGYSPFRLPCPASSIPSTFYSTFPPKCLPFCQTSSNLLPSGLSASNQSNALPNQPTNPGGKGGYAHLHSNLPPGSPT